MNAVDYYKDVQFGDIVYHFLEGNKPYRVIEVDRKNKCITLEAIKGEDKQRECYFWDESQLPVYLFKPVEVLDPKNLPERETWVPEPGEYVLARQTYCEWVLVKFVRVEENGFLCKSLIGAEELLFSFIAPFDGTVPRDSIDDLVSSFSQRSCEQSFKFETQVIWYHVDFCEPFTKDSVLVCTKDGRLFSAARDAFGWSTNGFFSTRLNDIRYWCFFPELPVKGG